MLGLSWCQHGSQEPKHCIQRQGMESLDARHAAPCELGCREHHEHELSRACNTGARWEQLSQWTFPCTFLAPSPAAALLAAAGQLLLSLLHSPPFSSLCTAGPCPEDNSSHAALTLPPKRSAQTVHTQALRAWVNARCEPGPVPAWAYRLQPGFRFKAGFDLSAVLRGWS